MKNLSAGLSVVLQVLYAWSLVSVVIDAVVLYQGTLEQLGANGGGDPKLLAGAISQLIVEFLVAGLVPFFGLAIALYLVRSGKFRSQWFVSFNRILAIAWLIYFPIGTIFGALMIYWSGQARVKESADAV